MSSQVQTSSPVSVATLSQSILESVQDGPTALLDQQSNTWTPIASTSSSEDQIQFDNSANVNTPISPSKTPGETPISIGFQDVVASTFDGGLQSTVPLIPQSQATIADAGGDTSFPSSTLSPPVSRTGLIRPSFTFAYTRPEDPVAGIQPGIAAASAFFFFGLVAIVLLVVRRLRRHRARRRTHSILNNHHEGAYKSVGSTKSFEKPQVHLTLSDVESGLVENNAGVGAQRDPALDELKRPVAARTYPDSVKGFKEGPFPTMCTGPASAPQVRFALPYTPAKPSPLRES